MKQKPNIIKGKNGIKQNLSKEKKKEEKKVKRKTPSRDMVNC